MQRSEEETKYATPEECLLRLREERAITYASRDTLEGFFKQNPFLQNDIKVMRCDVAVTHHTLYRSYPRSRLHFSQLFGRDSAMSTWNLIFSDNSPVAPAFRFGVRALEENGAVEALNGRWFDTELASASSAVDVTVINIGQVAQQPLGSTRSNVILYLNGNAFLQI